MPGLVCDFAWDFLLPGEFLELQVLQVGRRGIRGAKCGRLRKFRGLSASTGKSVFFVSSVRFCGSVSISFRRSSERAAKRRRSDLVCLVDGGSGGCGGGGGFSGKKKCRTRIV